MRSALAALGSSTDPIRHGCSRLHAALTDGVDPPQHQQRAGQRGVHLAELQGQMLTAQCLHRTMQLDAMWTAAEPMPHRSVHMHTQSGGTHDTDSSGGGTKNECKQQVHRGRWKGTGLQAREAVTRRSHVVALAVGALGAILQQAHHHDNQECAPRKEPALQCNIATERSAAAK